MLSITDLRGRVPSTAELRKALPRGAADVDSMIPTVRPVVEAVRDGGAEAANGYSETFDGIRPAHLKVPAEELARAVDTLEPQVWVEFEFARESLEDIELCFMRRTNAEIEHAVEPTRAE